MIEEKSPARIRIEKTRQRSQQAGKQQTASRPNHQQTAEGFHAKKTMPEFKTRRVQLVLKPSVFEKLKKRAALDEVSVNEYITQLIEKNV